MKTSALIAVLALLIPATAAMPVASGTIGIYAIIDRVVFEPNEQSPERLRVHGAFAFVDGGVGRPLGVTVARRGIMRFRIPTAADVSADTNVAVIKREWADLKSVAGTGQAVGFGGWFYFGQFANFRPDGTDAAAPNVLASGMNTFAPMRVSAPADSGSAFLVPYQTNVGVVRLTEASHAAVINALKAVPR